MTFADISSQSAQEHARALDKLLMAYGSIGANLPRLSRYADTFPNNREFQQLIAFLFEDIVEFHRKAYCMIRKPGICVFPCQK
jgi:hypothetical protein